MNSPGSLQRHDNIEMKNQGLPQKQGPSQNQGLPEKQGLYDPQFEHDSCGVGFVVDMFGRKSNSIVRKALQVLINLQHRGAKGCEINTGDGAGILIQVPHVFLSEEMKKSGVVLPE